MYLHPNLQIAVGVVELFYIITNVLTHVDMATDTYQKQADEDTLLALFDAAHV